MKVKSIFLASLLSLQPARGASPPSNMVHLPKAEVLPFFDRSKEGQKQKEFISEFYLDKYLVTNSDFLKFVRDNPKWQRSRVLKIFADQRYLSHWRGDLDFPASIKNEPVRFVSWFSANEYCKAQEKLLPTIVQWEYAAAADDKSKDASKSKEFRERILKWYSTPNQKKFEDVQDGFKNIWGVVGMHGVVWEWTLDFNTALVTGESREDSTINKDRFCGSGVLGAKDGTDYGAFMRYGFRSSLRGDYTVANLGFRCAKNIEETK